MNRTTSAGAPAARSGDPHKIGCRDEATEGEEEDGEQQRHGDEWRQPHSCHPLLWELKNVAGLVIKGA